MVFKLSMRRDERKTFMWEVNYQIAKTASGMILSLDYRVNKNVNAVVKTLYF